MAKLSVVLGSGDYKMTPSGCHIWQGSKGRDGVPTIALGGLGVPVRDVLFGGKATVNCGNPLCVRKDHLVAGRTQGHRLTGEEFEAAKAAIASGRTQKEVAEELGITQSGLSLALKRGSVGRKGGRPKGGESKEPEKAKVSTARKGPPPPAARR